MKTSQAVIGLFVVLVVLGGGYYFFSRTPFSEVPAEVATSTPLGATGTTTIPRPNLGLGVDTTKPTNKPAPSLSRPITFVGLLSQDQFADQRAVIKTEMEKLITALKKDKYNAEAWYDLAIYRKIISDYKGAAEVWEFTKEIQPDNFVSYHNLGDLYAYFDRDLKKAEANFLLALEKDPKNVDEYRAVADFYVTALQNKPRAVTILNQGIKENPKTSADLIKYRDLLSK